MASQLVRLRNIKRALSWNPAKLPNGGLESTVSGRVRSIRNMKSVNFIDLTDGSTFNHLQVVVDKSTLKKAEIGSYLTLQGLLSKSRGPKQAVEFKVQRILSLNPCDPEKFPMFMDEEATKDGLYRKYLHLRPQASHFASLLRVRSELELGIHMIMKQMDYFNVSTPILTSNDSEATSDLLRVERISNRQGEQPRVEETDDNSSDDETSSDDENRGQFFKKDVFLTTSAQLHLECLAASLSRVYTISNTFRAENSVGPRHLCEFTMFEAEEAGLVNLEHLMLRVESIIKFLTQFLSGVSEHSPDLLSLINRYSNSDNFSKLSESKYVHMTYSEAIDILRRKIVHENINFGKDINISHERILLKHCDNVPLFIRDYPQRLKPFYMKLSDNCKIDGPDQTVACFDLISPIGGEICGGSLREDDLEILRENIKKRTQNLSDMSDTQSRNMSWYLELREFGSFPHGGFGMGLERLLKSMLGIKNIRDVIPFPRWSGKCSM